MGVRLKGTVSVGASAVPHHKNLRDETQDIRDALADRCVELVSKVLGKPAGKSSRELRFYSEGQSKGGNPGFVLFISGARYGKFTDHYSGRHGDMLQFIEDYALCSKAFREVIAWAKHFLGWADGGSSLPIRRDAAQRREREEKKRADEAARNAEILKEQLEARRRWNKDFVSIIGTPGEQYLRNRKIFAENLHDIARWCRKEHAVVFAVTDDQGDIVALQYVAVTPEGFQNKQRLWRNNPKPRGKDSFAAVSAGAFRLPGKSDRQICYAEGPETAMSVWLATGYEVHALLGVNGFKRIPEIAPKDRRIIVLRDDDAEIKRAFKTAKEAVSTLAASGFDVREAWPFNTRKKNGGDFNDIPPNEIRLRIGIANYDAPIILPETKLSVEAARKKIDEHVGRFFEESWEWDVKTKQPVRVLKVKVGGGKTEAALRHAVRYVAKLRAAGDMRPIIYSIPEHHLADEIASRGRKIAAQENVDVVFDIYRGRAAINPETASPMCLKHEVVEKARSLAVRAEDEICPKCPLFKTGCNYLSQKKKSADIWIVAHDIVFSGLPKPLGDFTERNELGEVIKSGAAALIVDESIIQKGMRGVEGKGLLIPLDLLIDPSIPLPENKAPDFNGARLDTMRMSLAKALRELPEGPVPKSALRAIGFSADSGKAMARLEWSRIVTDGPWEERIENKTIRPFARLGAEIENALSTDGELCGNLTIVRTEEGAKAVRVTGRKKVAADLRTPTLLIGALADIEQIKHYWPQATLEATIDIETPHQRIRQFTGKSFGKTLLERPKTDDPKKITAWERRLRRLKAVILREARRVPGKVAVISNKGVIDELNLPKSIQTLHFNATAGRDHLGDVALLIVVGRPLPGPKVFEQMTGALTTAPPSHSYGQGWFEKGDAERLVIAADGGIAKVPAVVDRHRDETAQSLMDLICVGEIEQAIGRARGVNRTADNPVEIIVMTDVVLESAIDEVVPDEWLETTIDDEQLAEGGIAFEDGTAMAAAYPAIWASAAAARKARSRETPRSVTSSYKDTYTKLSRCSFQRAVQGAKPQVATFDPELLEDPTAAIEAIFGELTLFEVEDSAPILTAAPLDLPDSVPIDDGWQPEVVPEPIELQDITTVPVPIQISADGVTIRTAWVHIPIESAERPPGEELRDWCASVRRRAEDSGVLLGDIALKAGSSFGEFKAVERGLWPLRPELRRAFEAAVGRGVAA